MANLLIEIGNTALKAAWAEGKTLGKTVRYQGEKLHGFLIGTLLAKERPDVLVLASVRDIPAPSGPVPPESMSSTIVRRHLAPLWPCAAAFRYHSAALR